MGFPACRNDDGSIDFDRYRRSAATLRRSQRAAFARAIILAFRAFARAMAASYRSRSRCQPTVASGLASTEAK